MTTDRILALKKKGLNKGGDGGGEKSKYKKCQRVKIHGVC
jgi:hypothetical protein